jgi:hypothetical protein
MKPLNQGESEDGDRRIPGRMTGRLEMEATAAAAEEVGGGGSSGETSSAAETF